MPGVDSQAGHDRGYVGAHEGHRVASEQLGVHHYLSVSKEALNEVLDAESAAASAKRVSDRRRCSF